MGQLDLVQIRSGQLEGTGRGRFVGRRSVVHFDSDLVSEAERTVGAVMDERSPRRMGGGSHVVAGGMAGEDTALVRREPFELPSDSDPVHVHVHLIVERKGASSCPTT